MKQCVGFGVNHIAIFLVFQAVGGVFAPGEQGLVDAGDKSVVAHSHLAVFPIDQQAAHLGDGILALEGGQHGLKHEVVVPTQEGMGFDVIGAGFMHGLVKFCNGGGGPVKFFLPFGLGIGYNLRR